MGKGAEENLGAIHQLYSEEFVLECVSVIPLPPSNKE